jgi:hypothetical protein
MASSRESLDELIDDLEQSLAADGHATKYQSREQISRGIELVAASALKSFSRRCTYYRVETESSESCV